MIVNDEPLAIDLAQAASRPDPRRVRPAHLNGKESAPATANRAQARAVQDRAQVITVLGIR